MSISAVWPIILRDWACWFAISRKYPEVISIRSRARMKICLSLTAGSSFRQTDTWQSDWPIKPHKQTGVDSRRHEVSPKTRCTTRKCCCAIGNDGCIISIRGEQNENFGSLSIVQGGVQYGPPVRDRALKAARHKHFYRS